MMVDGWPVNSQYPQGHFVKLLGRIGDLETEIDSILVENSIEVTPFSQGILQELPSLESAMTWRPEDKEIAKRRDFRWGGFCSGQQGFRCRTLIASLIRSLYRSRFC
jgi:exoribonuclease R